jgi:CheY-like chemotaxis protein
MGLAAAAGIVRAYRGWIGVDETSAHGTTFGLLLPASREALSSRSEVAAAPGAALSARAILLIDDEPAVRLVTGRMLSERGRQVATAESGRRGGELLREQPESIDLVILDLTMPELSGEQTLEQLRLVRTEFLDKPHTLTSVEMMLASVGGRAPASGRGPRRSEPPGPERGSFAMARPVR